MTTVIGAGFVVAAARYSIDFFSPTVSKTQAARFTFYGVGIGAGGNASGFALPGIVPDTWTDFPSKIKFNVWDLNGADGAIGSVGVGVGVTVGATSMKAFRRSKVYFDFEGDIGLSGGFGAGFTGLAGTFRIKGTVKNVPVSDDDYYIA